MFSSISCMFTGARRGAFGHVHILKFIQGNSRHFGRVQFGASASVLAGSRCPVSLLSLSITGTTLSLPVIFPSHFIIIFPSPGTASCKFVIKSSRGGSDACWIRTSVTLDQVSEPSGFFTLPRIAEWASFNKRRGLVRTRNFGFGSTSLASTGSA